MNRPADRCPGVFATHRAADGQLARLRLSGGRIQPGQLDMLALAAGEFGDGHVEITGRANLQVRGISEDCVDAFAERLIDAGLAGSRSHDRVRNVVVSPFSGRLGGTAELWHAADRLDEVLPRTDWAHRLSGRFWFGFDDGRGDVLQRAPDVVGVVTGDRAELVLAGRPTGRTVPVADLADAMLQVAEQFLDLATDEWRIRDLPVSHQDSLLQRLDTVGVSGSAPAAAAAEHRPRVGWFDQDDGRVLLGAVTPFGRLSSRQAQFAAAIGSPLIVTPDRELLITDLTEGVAETVVRVLAPLGFVFDANSPWTRVSACTGAPGCAQSRADVRRLLAEHVDGGGEFDGHEHWVGCERSCGASPESTVRVAPFAGDQSR